MLMGLRDRADYVIDTTDMLPQKLRSTIRGLFATGSERSACGHRVLLRLPSTAPYDADSSWTCASCRTPITIRSCGR